MFFSKAFTLSGRRRKECARAVFQFLVRILVHSSRKRRGMRGTMNMETMALKRKHGVPTPNLVREADTFASIFLLGCGPQRDTSILSSLGFYPLLQSAFRHEIQRQFEGVSGNVALSNACLAHHTGDLRFTVTLRVTKAYSFRPFVPQMTWHDVRSGKLDSRHCLTGQQFSRTTTPD
ncbi:hypothetical protein EV363DRAFT_1341509 [Boletus edulis]|nr:hypothetical protein EV363DRAFT_1341509 [Boletus edulis]